MLYNLLDNSEKRRIETCNHNQHIQSRHADRVMNVHDLVYIKEGEWSIAQDGVCYDLKAGDILLLQGGHHHYGTAPCKGLVKTRFIHFNTHKNDTLNEIGEPSKGFYCFPTLTHCAGNPIFEKHFDRIISAFWSDDIYERAKASAYLDLLLCDMSAASAKGSSIVDDIKAQINRSPHRFIPNEELAKKYGWSVRTLTAKFKAETGIGIHAWQIEQKCKVADELLRNEPTLTLKEVAATYGFCDEYHFGKCFKRVMGRSPKRKR